MVSNGVLLQLESLYVWRDRSLEVQKSSFALNFLDKVDRAHFWIRDKKIRRYFSGNWICGPTCNISRDIILS